MFTQINSIRHRQIKSLFMISITECLCNVTCPELLPEVVEAGVEPRPFESHVWHANHYTTESLLTLVLFLITNEMAQGFLPRVPWAVTNMAGDHKCWYRGRTGRLTILLYYPCLCLVTDKRTGTSSAGSSNKKQTKYVKR